jgi:cobalamin biosynthesis protein CobT
VHLCAHSNLPFIRAPRNKDGEEEGSDDESEEESSEEEEEEEEVAPAAGGSTEQQPELSRVERTELKKKQAAAKQKQQEGDEEDEDLINPNHVTKKMNISDLGAPKELSRRERYCLFFRLPYIDINPWIREAKEKQDAKDRYWKARFSVPALRA